jgi:hypothetical protein
MRYLSTSVPGVIAVLSLLAPPPAARAAGPKEAGAVTTLKSAAGVAGQLLDTANLLDRITETKGPATTRVAARPVLEAVHLTVSFRVPGVEVQDRLTNEVLGREVPGRSVSATVRVDCLVHCAMDAGKVRLEADPDYPDTVVVVLPPFGLSAGFPEGELAEYEVEYGGLRSPWLDKEKAAELRRQMYATAREKAIAQFREESLAPLRRDVARAVERSLRDRFPSRRIHVTFGE